MKPGFRAGPTFEIFREGSAVAIPFVVCNSDAARFEGTVRVCEVDDDGIGFGLSFCGWGCGFGTWIGILSAGGSAGASWLCEKRQLVRLQLWISGHLVFLNSPRLENMMVSPRARSPQPTIEEEEMGKVQFGSIRISDACPHGRRLVGVSLLPLHLFLMATRRNTKQRARAGSIQQQLERIESVFFSLFPPASGQILLNLHYRTDPAHHLTGPFQTQTYNLSSLSRILGLLNVSLGPLIPRMVRHHGHQQQLVNLRRMKDSGLTSGLFVGLYDHVRIHSSVSRAYTHLRHSFFIQNHRSCCCALYQLGDNHSSCRTGIT